ncbi:hypothetical protein GCM10022212_23510 [Actimicrobium antarcticum]|uniref:Uncharacterized protein n=1 Tax=Actimicrobium antarcticum TaxID=1051899 RepID=A0ABP7TEJ7_9BURK
MGSDLAAMRGVGNWLAGRVLGGQPDVLQHADYSGSPAAGKTS